MLDPTRVSETLGGEAALRELAAAGLGIVLDVVPNHMARSEENRWWADPELRRRFFDIDPQTGFWKGGGKLTQVTPQQGGYEATRLDLIEPKEIENAAYR